MTPHDWLMIGIGAVGAILVTFFFFGFVLNDKPAVAALTWVAKRKNISRVYLGLAVTGAAVILVMLGSAYAEALKMVHIYVAPWVLPVAGVILGLIILSLIVIAFERKKRTP